MALSKKQDLKLDRKLQNEAFQSWRLAPCSSRIDITRHELDLPGKGIMAVKNEAVDFLHTRASLLRNHIIESQGRRFCFTTGTPISGESPLMHVNEISLCQESASVSLRCLAGASP